MFDLYVLKEWPVREVAQALGVSTGRVYLAKHRVSVLVKREIKREKVLLEQAAKNQTGQTGHQHGSKQSHRKP
jgi:hypothetical protein